MNFVSPGTPVRRCLSATQPRRCDRSQLQLWTGQKATVTEVTGTDFKIDWNPDLAGTSLVGLWGRDCATFGERSKMGV